MQSNEDVRQQWRDARDHLDIAIQRFLERTIALDTAIRDPINRSIIDDTILEVTDDLNNMLSRVENLKISQATLNQIRNRSDVLVPINKLPSEILVSIFQFSTWAGSCGQYDLSATSIEQHHSATTLFSLTSICTHWRSILIHTPSFWSHARIQLETETERGLELNCNRVQLCFQRAQHLPLCVGLEGQLDSQSVSMIADCLRPYIGNMKSLKLADIGDFDILGQFLSFWLANGQAGSVQNLLVWRNGRKRRFCKLQSIDKPSQGTIDSFLQPIRVLRLNGAHFDWDSPAYCGLVMLHVGSLDILASPTLGDILGVLAACPQLKILQLYNMSIRAGDQDDLQPMDLPELKVLDLSRLDSEGVCLLLPMIHPQSEDFGVRVDLHADSITASVVQSFLARTSVTVLFIAHPPSSDGITEYLSATQNLHTLILDMGSEPGDDLLEAITHPSESDAERISICPKLHTLYLIQGLLQHTTVQAAVRAHPLIKKVVFATCCLEPADEELRSRIKSMVKEMKDIKMDGGMSTSWYLLMT
jgi:hypothetical protein